MKEESFLIKEMMIVVANELAPLPVPDFSHTRVPAHDTRDHRCFLRNFEDVGCGAHTKYYCSTCQVFFVRVVDLWLISDCICSQY